MNEIEEIKPKWEEMKWWERALFLIGIAFCAGFWFLAFFGAYKMFVE